MNSFAIPAKLRLDNAANIYPASMSKYYSSLYRMSMTLTDPVDPAILQQALEQVSERIPTFRCRLKAGGFWWYLQRQEAIPQVLPLKKLAAFRFIDQHGFLYRVSADGHRICLDVFHALTDGSGAMSFLATLTAAYIHKRYQAQIQYNSLVLDPADRPIYREVEDSFKAVFTGRKGELEKNVDAYHIGGAVMPGQHLMDVRAVASMQQVKQACQEMDCTVTDLVTAAMLAALQDEYQADPCAKKRCSVLKVSVPVNLRPLYGSRTLRNFSSYVNLGVDVADGYRNLRELVDAVKTQKEHDLQQENLEPKIAANVQLEEMTLVKCLPLAVKHPIIDLINRLHGDRFYSQTLSNLGKVDLPEGMRPYVTDVDFVLGRQRGNSGAVACLGYNGKLCIHLSRKIFPARFEHAFLRHLESVGIATQMTETALA